MNKLVFVLLILIIACKSSDQAAKSRPEIDSIIEANLGSKYERIDRGEMALCQSIDVETNGTWRTILVVDLVTGQLIHGPERVNGVVSWHTDGQLLIREFTEVIRDKQSGSEGGYIFDLKTKQRVSASH